MTRTKLGSVWTDIATLLIGDPCRFIKEPGESPEITHIQMIEICHSSETADAESEEFDRIMAEIKANPGRFKELFPKLPRLSRDSTANYEGRQIPPHKGLVVNVESDGYYPVYLVRNAKGEPVRIEILLGGKVEP
jgi:hypothetical protein